MPETAYALAFDTANEVISIGLGRLNAAACAVEPVAAVEVAAHRASNTQLLVRVDALLSRQLLMNIFYPKAPLHDGAVLISKGRITAAACILPLAEAKGQSFGTRHRAAIGVSETTDAIVLIVSEETGIISMAKGGKLTRHLDAKSLRTILEGIYVRKPHQRLLSMLVRRKGKEGAK